MDGPTLTGIVYKGYGIAAANIGYPFDIYRPTSAITPISIGNKIVVNQQAAFTDHSAPNFQFGKPSDHKGSLFHGMFDATSVSVGDFFVNAAVGTFAVISKQPVNPPLCVSCGRRMTFSRPFGEAGFGVGAYGGSVPATETVLMTNWPCSVLEQGNSKSAGGTLPGDGGALRWDILLTAWPGVALRVSDIAVDDLGNRYILSGAEYSDLGWRLKAAQAVI